MATLLHLDSSLNGDASASRAVTAAFRTAWEKRHPDGRVVHRDLAEAPVPHFDAVVARSAGVPADAQTPQEKAAAAYREALLTELESADAIVIGAPMYNYTIPSTLKAWIDHVLVIGRTAATGQRTTEGKPVTVVASRGGSYAPGTPQEGNDYVQNYLGYVLGDVLGFDLEFIVPELTLAASVPAMAELVPLAEASRTRALGAAEERATALADRLAS